MSGRSCRIGRNAIIGTALAVAVVASPVAPSSATTVTVAPGETLLGIAHEYGTTVAALEAANDLTDPNTIVAGSVLQVPGAAGVAADAPMTIAAVSERLGLRGLSRESARLASDKLAMKQRFLEAGVPVPWFGIVQTSQALARIAIERGSDLVIKPVDSRGSRGVQRISRVRDLNAAFQLAYSYSPTGRVMVEQYLVGPQVSTESVVVEAAGTTLDTRSAAAQWAPSYMRATWMQAPLALVSLVCGVAVWLMSGGTGWLIAAVLIGLVVPFTSIGIMPTNKSLLLRGRDLDSPDTRALLERWGRLHMVRTALSLVATVL